MASAQGTVLAVVIVILQLLSRRRLAARWQNSPCVAPLGPLRLTAQGLDGLILRAQSPASVSGTVKDPSGTPLADVPVALLLKGFPFWNQGSKTNARGEFHIERVFPGEFVVGGIGPKITVRPGEAVTGLTLTYPKPERKGLTISGTIHDEHGAAVAGIGVTAFPPFIVGRGPRTFPTDSKGFYRIEGLTEGEYSVEVSDAAERYRDTWRQSVTAGSTDVDFVVKEASSLEGQVVRADNGQPLTDFKLCCASGTNLDLASHLHGFAAIHDVQGQFRRGLVRNEVADWALWARAPGFATEVLCLPHVSPDKSVKGLIIRLPRGGTIKGVVLGPDGQPVPETRIIPGKWVFMKGTTPAPITTTRYDGTFEIHDCAPVAQMFTACHPGLAPTWSEVTPKSDESVPMKIHLIQGASLEGNVTLHGQQISPEQSHEMWDMVVSIYYGAAPPPQVQGCGVPAKSHYILPSRLPPGHAHVRLTLGGGVQRSLEREIDLKDGQAANLDFDFAAAPCAIAGNLLWPDGATWWQVTITTRTPAGLERRVVTPGRGTPATFSIEHLPAGPGVLSAVVGFKDKHKTKPSIPIILRHHETLRHDIDLR